MTGYAALPPASPLLRLWRRSGLAGDWAGGAGLAIILVLAIAALIPGLVAPYDPLGVDYAAIFAPPGPHHWLGTDSFGRDILSRIVYGARTALVIGAVSSLAGCVAGAAVGVVSAYFGGWVDAAIQLLIDIVLALPIIVLALVVVTVLGHAPLLGVDANLVLAIAVPMVPRAARVLRPVAQAIKAEPYIDAARAGGFSAPRIMARHVAPNLASPFLVLWSAYVAQAILLESSLTYLGLGVTEPTPAWGLMLAGNASDNFKAAPWIVIFPGLAITLAVIAFNLFGDALRDRLDPRGRR